MAKAWEIAIDRGMGMEFKFEGSSLWHDTPVMFNDSGTPAKCIKVRCWVKK